MDQEVRLTSDELQLVDSLFVKQRNIWSIQLEDSCKAFHDQNFDHWVDSMERERLKEIEMLLKR